MPKTITCVNCNGSGYIFTFSYDGMKHPVTCPGCQGTGQQTVRGGR